MLAVCGTSDIRRSRFSIFSSKSFVCLSFHGIPASSSLADAEWGKFRQITAPVFNACHASRVDSLGTLSERGLFGRIDDLFIEIEIESAPNAG
jgi:hypothetical protein